MWDSNTKARTKPTSFPGSFIKGRSLWGGEMKDPGNEVGTKRKKKDAPDEI